MLGTQSKWQKLGRSINELEFITSTFSWIFNLLSRVAEPLMTLAVIYTIIVSGLPQTMVPALYNLALAVMIGAPEVILPGAFIMAGQQQQGGNKRAWMLFGVCILFILLTSLTLADLFIFHFNETGTSVLMCARCVTGVSYSILVRVVSHEHSSYHLKSSQTFDQQAFMNQVLDQVSQMNQQLVQDIHHSQEQFMNQVAEISQESVKQAITQIERQCDAAQAKSNGAQLQLLAHTRSAGARIHREPQSFAPLDEAEPENRKVHRLTEIHGDTPSFTVHEETEHENGKVHTLPDIQEEDDVHKLHMSVKAEGGGRVNREQVSAFILNHWREHRVKPTIKFIRESTGCSQGLASECCKLVAHEMNA
jgi:hypothetical protein